MVAQLGDAVRIDGMTADEHRAEAVRCNERSAESFDRCDTDGFLSQWASDASATVHRLNADVCDNGGVWEFPALFDLEGRLVAAKLVYVDDRFSPFKRAVWAVLASDDPKSAVVRWVARPTAKKAARRAATLAAKGYTEGVVSVPARAVVSNGWSSSAHLIRRDGGFSRDAVVVSTTDDREFE